MPTCSLPGLRRLFPVPVAWPSANWSSPVHQDSGLYLKELIEPVLTCFNDADSRLRYYACEALYNIVKVARGSVLPHFNVLFDGLSKVRSFLSTLMCFYFPCWRSKACPLVLIFSGSNKLSCPRSSFEGSWFALTQAGPKDRMSSFCSGTVATDVAGAGARCKIPCFLFSTSRCIFVLLIEWC